MPDIVTDYPGIKIRKIRNRNYVVINLEKMAHGSISIGGLAKFLHLQPETVLNALLGYRSNAHVIKTLFRDYAPNHNWTNYGTARRILRENAYTYSASNETGTIRVTTTPYLDWDVQYEKGKPILFPLTAGFKKFLKEVTAKRKRMARYKAASPTFQTLKSKDLPDLKNKISTLKLYIKLLKEWTKGDVKDVLLLEALNGLLGAMLGHPKKKSDASDIVKVSNLRIKLLKLKNQAYYNYLIKPPDAPDIEGEANDLIKTLEDPGFEKRIKVLVEYKDVADSHLWLNTCETLKEAYITLLLTSKADDILEKHIIPMINTVGSKVFDINGMPNLKHAKFKKAIINVPQPSNSNSVLNTIGRLLATTRLTVRNLPAAQYLVDSVVEQAAPLIMSKILHTANASDDAAETGGLLFRFIVNSAGLDQRAQNVLLLSIDNGRLNELKKVNFSRCFANSPAWGSALAIVGAIAFIVEIQRNDNDTLRKWANLISSASTTLLGVSVAFSRYSTLIEEGIVEGIGGKILGIVGGIASVIVGIETAEEEYKTGDHTGTWLAGLGALGGAMTVAGFLISAGAGTSATGVGAPLGLVLIISGTIVAVGAGIWSFLRNVFTPGSEKVFEAFILHFGKEVAYDLTAPKRPALATAYNDVKTYFRSVDFWNVSTSVIPQMHDLGFPVKCIAAIVDEDTDYVKKSLHRAGRKIT